VFYVVRVYIVSLDVYIERSILHGHYLKLFPLTLLSDIFCVFIVITTVLGVQYNLGNSSVCNLIHSVVASLCIGLTVHLSHILSLCSFSLLMVVGNNDN